MNATVENSHKPEHTVLLIDDEPANLRVLADYLTDRGIEVLMARDGEEGIEKARYIRPDLILLDVLMPGIDGFETCRRLKSDETTQDIPVIFTTIVIGPEDKIQGFEVGGVDYIPKPFQHEEVLARVITHLRIRDLTRKLQEAKETLEMRVEERTAELARANQELHLEIAERKQVEKALQESETRYRSLFEDSPISLWEEDFSQVKTYFDELRASGVTDWRTYFESHPEAVAHCAGLVKILDVNQATLTLLEARDKDELLAGLPQVLADKALRVFCEELITLAEGGRQFESEDEIHRTVTGHKRFVNIRTSVAPGYEDTLGKVLVSLLDVTEGKQAEEELKKHRDHLEELVQERTTELTVAKEQAETANRAKSAFLTNMSHELRTPLNAILGYAQILQRQPLEPDVIDDLRTVQRSGEHLLTLITDILDLSRIEAGRMELHPAPIHFPNFLDHIAGIIRSRAEAKDLTFTFDTPPISPPEGGLPAGVQADETRLRQVLLNLLDNAVKFTDEGSVTLRVKQMGKSANEQMGRFADLQILRFEVEDTGPGIPPDQLERIFLPFEQARDLTHPTKGTGLGLAISRQLVQLMGGELYVQSEPGRGSLFWFEIALPVIEVAVEVAPPLERVITGYKGPRRTVLVADDVPSNRAVLIDLLQPLGFDVVEAADGQQAIHLARELRPDLILMDRWMPVLDGFEAAQQMRHIPELKAVPVVAISASVSKEDQTQSRAAGLNAFLPKPVSWPNLAALLEEHLKLEWTYGQEQGSREAGEQGKTFPSAPRPPAPLVPPPQEELTILLDLARRGNMRAIRERAAHIETLGEQYIPFARKLSELARGFEEEHVLALVERYMEEETESEERRSRL